MEEFLQVGAIANTHGIAGEVKVFPMTDDIKRFKKLKEVYLRKKTITRSVMQIRKEPAGFEI